MASIRPILLQHAGAPTSGGSGTFHGDPSNGKGALLVDVTNGVLYLNTGTGSSPTWSAIGSVAESTLTAAIPTTTVAAVAAADIVGAAGANPTQAEYATAVTLANETKAKLNLVLARLQTAGIIS